MGVSGPYPMAVPIVGNRPFVASIRIAPKVPRNVIFIAQRLCLVNQPVNRENETGLETDEKLSYSSGAVGED